MTLARLLRIVQQSARSLVAKEAADSELSSELAFHLDQLAAENIAEGMFPEAALAAARRALGNRGAIEEECRDQRALAWVHDFLQDARYGLRMLRASPVFTAVAAISLALGIGGNIAVLSVMDSVRGGSIVFPDPERLMILRTFQPGGTPQLTNASLASYLVWKARSRSFASMGASLANQQDFDADDSGNPAERYQGQAFTPGLFTTLGVPPLLGRYFTEDESRLDNPAAVILISHRLWQTRYAADPRILARSISLNGRLTRIVGVMPAGFHYVVDNADYWAPLRFDRIHRPETAPFYIVAARLKPGVPLKQAQAEMSAWGVRLQPIRDALFGWTTRSLYTMEAAILLVLLIACANVSLLLLARTSARRQEMALRAALGAGPGRIVRQFLTESMILSLAGGAAGLLLAWIALHAVTIVKPPPGATHLPPVPLDLRALLTRPLRSQSGRLRGILVATEIAVAMILLAGAGLLMKSFVRLATREFNFNPKGLITFEYRLPPQEYLRQNGPEFTVDPAPVANIARIAERLKSIPGATGVAGISLRPVNSLVLTKVVVRPSLTSAAYFLLTPGYFRVIEAQIIKGREIEEGDTRDRPWVAVINETMARRLWPEEDALGKHFVLEGLAEDRPREVVGVIRDIPTRSADLQPEPVIYASYLQQPVKFSLPGGTVFGQMTFVLRSTGKPDDLIPAARRIVADVDPDHPLSSVVTVEQLINGRTPELGSYVLVLIALAMAATMLAVMGVYGVTAFAIAQRTREIGIRIALGATRYQIFSLVGRWAILLTGTGVVTGVAGSLAMSVLIESQLWGVSANDPAVFAGAALLLMLTALLACWLPARRAVARSDLRA